MMKILNEQNVEITEAEVDLTKGRVRTEVIIKPDAEPVDDISKFAYADDDYETIQRYIVIPAEDKIATLKAHLSATDYVVIKIAEGAATADEYADVITQRQQWREQINALEAETNAD